MADKRVLKIEIDMDDNTGKVLNSLDNKVNKTKDNFARLRNTLLTVFSVNVLKNFVADSIKLFAIEEQAVSRLTSVMRGVNNATDEQIESLKVYSAELQKTTTFGNEQIISAQAMLGTFQLSTEQIKKLTPRVLDMGSAMAKATGTGSDLESITIAVGKAMTSGIGSLSRYGVVITDTQKDAFDLANQQEKVSIITDALDSNFKGIAEGSAKTFSGRLKQLNNNFGDLKENVGKAFLVLTNDFIWALSGSIEATNKNVESTNKWIIAVNRLKIGWISLGTAIPSSFEKLKRASAKFNKATFGQLDKALGGGEDALSHWDEQIDESTGKIEGLETELALMVSEIDDMNSDLRNGTFNWEEFSGSANKAEVSVGNYAEGAGEAGKKTDEMSNKLEKAKQSILNFNEKLSTAFNETRDNLKQLGKELESLKIENNKGNTRIDNEFAQAFVDQEKKVEELRGSFGKESDKDKKKLLQDRLKFEESELSRFSTIAIAFEKKVDEVRRRNSLSDIARTVEDLAKKRFLLTEEFQAKLKEKNDELKLENDKLEILKKIENLHIKELDRFNARREKMTLESVNRQIAFYNQLGKAIANSSSGKSTSSIGLSKDIQRRTDQAISSINITIEGDVSGDEVIEKVKNGIMNDLMQNTKLAF